MNKKYFLTAILAGMLTPALAFAQDETTGFGAKLSAGVDYKVFKGFHLHASEELWLDGTSGFDRSYTIAGLSYKFTDWLKAEAEYYAMAVSRTSSAGEEYLTWKHRCAVSLTGTYKFGEWRFSLRERIQGTYTVRDINEFQNTKFAVASRTRLKVAYRFHRVPLVPYVLAEMRVALNEPKWSQDGTSLTDYTSATWQGHNDAYIDRWRVQAGLEWLLNARNSIEFYFIYDRTLDKEIDSNKEGTSLKLPITETIEHQLYLGIGYTFAF